MVKIVLDHTSKTNSFTNNQLGKDWWYAFLWRHRRVNLQIPQALQTCRATAYTPEVMDKWYNDC